MTDEITRINAAETVDTILDNPRSNAVVTAPPPRVAVGSVAATAVAQALDPPSATRISSAPDDRAPLLNSNEATEFRGKWDSIQVAFVDQPRKAVEEADTLVQEAMNRLSAIFGNERQNLEQQWERKENVSTEDLRLALQRYRSFFSRLLSI